MSTLSILILALTASAAGFTPSAHAEAARAERFNIRSDYQLMVLDRDGLPFNANENLFETSPQLEAADQIFRDVRASTVRSFIPLAGQLFEGGGMGKADILRASMTVTRLLARAVQGAIRRNRSATVFPLEHQLFLVPWNQQRSDLFYGANKITVQVPGAVNLLSVSTFKNKFQNDVAFAIKRKLALLNANTTDPVMFGGFRGRVYLDPNFQKSFLGSYLEVQAILGIREQTIPFPDDTSGIIRIRQIGVPTPTKQATLLDKGVALGNRPTSVAITIRQLLPIDGTLPDPTLNVLFGEFEGFDSDTNIQMRQDNLTYSVPRFESDVDYKLMKADYKWIKADKVNKILERIAIQLNFTSIAMTLSHNFAAEKGPKFDDIDVLTSVGLNIKGKQHVWGHFLIEKAIGARVDEEMMKAFQRNLDYQIRLAREKLQAAAKEKSDELKNLGQTEVLDKLPEELSDPLQKAVLKLLGYASPKGVMP